MTVTASVTVNLAWQAIFEHASPSHLFLDASTHALWGRSYWLPPTQHIEVVSAVVMLWTLSFTLGPPSLIKAFKTRVYDNWLHGFIFYRYFEHSLRTKTTELVSLVLLCWFEWLLWKTPLQALRFLTQWLQCGTSLCWMLLFSFSPEVVSLSKTTRSQY